MAIAVQTKTVCKGRSNDTADGVRTKIVGKGMSSDTKVGVSKGCKK